LIAALVLFWSIPLAAAAIRRAVVLLATTRYKSAPATDGRLPAVTVVCPCHNESAHAAELVAGLRELEYPRLGVVLVDDGSTDDTSEILAAAVRGCAGWNSVRLEGDGSGKAAAVGAASAFFDPDGVVLVLDADHRLEPDALHRVARYFADPDVAAVTFRHEPRNRDASIVSRFCALESAVSEEVTARGQDALGAAPNLAGVWAARTTALRAYDLGHELADDAVLAGRLKGRIRYAADIRTHHAVPERLHEYVRQHLRWTAGLYASLVTPRRRGFAAWLDASFMRAGYLEHPLAVAGAIGGAVVVSAYHSTLLVLLPVAAWAVVMAAQTVAAMMRERYTGRESVRAVLSLLLVPVDAAVAVWGLVLVLRRRRPAWD